jgi:hypothetical protein
MVHAQRSLALFACSLLAAGCSDTPADPTVDTQIEAQVTQDAARYAGGAAVDDLRLMLRESGGLDVTGPAPVEEESELSISRSITFFDSLGAEMDQFDPLLTATVQIVSSVSGTRSRSGPRGTINVTIDRDRAMAISNLLGEETERQWDGGGNSAKNRVVTSDEQGTREYDMADTVTVTAVLIPVPHGSGYPLSGTIERVISMERTNGEDTQTRQRTVLVEFNGTRFVPITINGETFTLDLETRDLTEG